MNTGDTGGGNVYKFQKAKYGGKKLKEAAQFGAQQMFTLYFVNG